MPSQTGVTDEQFEEAVTEAKVEKNLSRANVGRKINGQGGRPPATNSGRGALQPDAAG